MGIIKTASDDFDADVAAFKLSATPTRAQLRKYVAALVTRGQTWLSKRDADDNGAAQAFADSKPAQFSTFVDALPDPTLDPVDPQL